MGGLDTQGAILAGAALVDFGIQLAGWAVATLLKSEKFYDALGSVAYLTLALGSLAYGGTYHARQVAWTCAVAAWTLRLGSFLVLRVLRTGGDSRFDEIKHRPLSFLVAWVLQGVWVWVVSLPLLLLNAAPANPAFVWTDAVGAVAWVAGFLIETTADFQKLGFKADPDNQGRFIDVGLWRYARFPNYFGEILLWTGVFLGCCAVFEGAEWAAVVSPVFVSFLLLFVSGVPLQEQQALARWGAEPAYQAYRARTNLLVPLPFKILPAATRRE
jgi:steroid 5-alpha reductase family enzyme